MDHSIVISSIGLMLWMNSNVDDFMYDKDFLRCTRTKDGYEFSYVSLFRFLINEDDIDIYLRYGKELYIEMDGKKFDISELEKGSQTYSN